ncbi:hypothetical protein ACWEF6_01740 [Amycolatopsis sp. NPDC004772]
MAWETIEGNGGGDFEEREKLAVTIGSKIEGTVKRVGDRHEGTYGDVRWVDVDTLDGVEGVFPARKILLDRVEDADLKPGDQIRIEFVSEKPKKGGKPYNKPILQVNRGGGATAKKADPKPAPKSKPEPATDEPDF